MTLEEMEVLVFQELSESASSPKFWTSADVRKALNDGYEEISDATEWFERTTPIHLLARRTYHDLRGYVLNSGPVLTIRRVFLPSVTSWLRPVHVREIDGDNEGLSYYPKWEEHETTPGHFFLRSLFWLGIFPRIASDGQEVARISHSSLPPPLTDDDDEPGFPVVFHPAIVQYALYDLHCRDKEPMLALENWSNYLSLQRDLAAYVDQRQSVDRVIRMSEEEPIG